MGWSILRRALVLGMFCGGVVGAVVGTVMFPVVGTLVGAGIGAEVGAVIGLLNAPGLMAVAQRTRRRWPAATAAAATTGPVAALALRIDEHDDPVRIALVTVTVVLAAVVGPLAAFGRRRRPRVAGAAHLARDAWDSAGDGFARGAVVGFVLGATGGLVIGLLSQPPTTWAAAYLLASVTTPVGAVIGAAVGCARGSGDCGAHARTTGVVSVRQPS